MANTQLKSVPSLADSCRAYIDIKGQIKKLEEQLTAHKTVIEGIASENDGSIELRGFKVSISPSSREVFDLKKARQKLGEKVFVPFLRVSSYYRLSVKEVKAF